MSLSLTHTTNLYFACQGHQVAHLGRSDVASRRTFELLLRGNGSSALQTWQTHVVCHSRLMNLRFRTWLKSCCIHTSVSDTRPSDHSESQLENGWPLVRDVPRTAQGSSFHDMT